MFADDYQIIIKKCIAATSQTNCPQTESQQYSMAFLFNRLLKSSKKLNESWMQGKEKEHAELHKFSRLAPFARSDLHRLLENRGGHDSRSAYLR